MRLNSKVTWGLAWTGLALILAVPSADFLTGHYGADARKAAVLTSDTEPVKPETAAATTAKTATATPAAPVLAPAKTTTVRTIKTDKGVTIIPAGSTAPESSASDTDPVDKYLSTGKPLPDYIADEEAPAEATEVATASPAPIVTPPRMPLPATARPKPLPTTAPATTPQPVVIVDEDTLTGSIVVPTSPVPPAPIVDDGLDDESESLREYLERRGILDNGGGGGRSTATVTERDSNYDPDGFFLSEGPNNDRTTRPTRRPRNQLILEEDDDGFTLF